MRLAQFLLSIILLFGVKVNAQISASTTFPLTIGDQLSFHSEILDQDRILNIYLPTYYNPDSAQLYPVIYLLDGSMDEDFLHISGIIQFGSYSWINLFPECIVVGISNIDRKHDFTFPTSIKEDELEFPTTGGSEDFIQCLAREIQPLIEAKYRCGEERILIGQSLGGLLATEILFKNPDLFSHYLIVSPSLWWDEESLLEAEITQEVTRKKVCIAVGAEGSNMIGSAAKLNEKLQSYITDADALAFIFMPEHDHGDILHLAAYRGLTALFKTNQP